MQIVSRQSVAGLRPLELFWNNKVLIDQRLELQEIRSADEIQLKE